MFKEHITDHPMCKDVFSYFPFGFEGRIWDLIVSVPDHCLSFYFLSWDPKGEEKRGIAWLERAKCDWCNYVSKKFKLYEEVEKTETSRGGRKTAKTNISTQIGLMQTPIGNTALRKVLLSANIPAPSSKGLQKSSKFVRKSVEEQNKRDIQKRRKNLFAANIYRNEGNITAVDVEGDGIYNNKLYSGVGKTQFQPSTQMVYILVENSTPEKLFTHHSSYIRNLNSVA